jgi:hypothetical protein
VALDEVLYFLCDDGNVGTEGILGETKLDKLFLISVYWVDYADLRTFFCSISFEFGQS